MLRQFAQVPLRLLEDDQICAGAKVFLARLLRWDWGGGCWLTEKQLAFELGVTERTVRNHTKALEASGHLWVFQDREGMTVRLVVRPGGVYPKPHWGMDSLPGKPRKMVSASRTRDKVLNHGFEVHTTTKAGGSSVRREAHPPTKPGVVSEHLKDSDGTAGERSARDPEPSETEAPGPTPNPERQKADTLQAAGVAPGTAHRLAQRFSGGRIGAAVAYAAGYRSGVLNRPGLVIDALQSPYKLPRWAWVDGKRQNEETTSMRATSAAQEARSPVGVGLESGRPSEGESGALKGTCEFRAGTSERGYRPRLYVGSLDQVTDEEREVYEIIPGRAQAMTTKGCSSGPLVAKR